jgi:hypothetical protein
VEERFGGKQDEIVFWKNKKWRDRDEKEKTMKITFRDH